MCKRNRPRLRLCYTTWPRPAIELTDTPRPRCPNCRGDGGWSQDYADAEGEYGGTHEYLCDCWKPDRAWLLLPIPRWLARRFGRGWPQDGYSSEPPF